MKKIIFALSLFALIGGTGCKKKYEEYAKNPNVPVSSPAYLLLRGILKIGRAHV